MRSSWNKNNIQRLPSLPSIINVLIQWIDKKINILFLFLPWTESVTGRHKVLRLLFTLHSLIYISLLWFSLKIVTIIQADVSLWHRCYQVWRSKLVCLVYAHSLKPDWLSFQLSQFEFDPKQRLCNLRRSAPVSPLRLSQCKSHWHGLCSHLSATDYQQMCSQATQLLQLPRISHRRIAPQR